MAIPKSLDAKIVELVLEKNHRIRKGKLSTDATRAKCVALITEHGQHIPKLIEEVLRMQYRLNIVLALIPDDQNIRLKAFETDEFKSLLTQTNPDIAFAQLRQLVPDSRLVIDIAEKLGMGVIEILTYAIYTAAEGAGCREDIATLFEDLKPRVKKETVEEVSRRIDAD